MTTTVNLSSYPTVRGNISSSSSSSSCTALVPYVPTPSFLHETNPLLVSFCKYNPYAVLGLPMENIQDLFNLVSLRNEDQHETLINQRKQRIQEVYRILANIYHPDKYEFNRCKQEKKGNKVKQHQLGVKNKENVLSSSGILQSKDQNSTIVHHNRRRPRPMDDTMNINVLLLPENSSRTTNGLFIDEAPKGTDNTHNKNNSVSLFYPTPVYKNELYSWIPIEERFAAINNSANILRDLSLTLRYFSLKYQDIDTPSLSAQNSSSSPPDQEKFYQILNLIQMRQALEYRQSMEKVIDKLRYDMIFNRSNDGLLILLGLYGDLSSLPIVWIDPTIEINQLPYYWQNIKNTTIRNNPLSLLYRSSSSSLVNSSVSTVSNLDTYLPSSSVMDVTGILQSLIEINHQPHKDTSSSILTPNHKNVSSSTSSTHTSIENSVTTNPVIQLSLLSGSKCSKYEGIFYDPCNNYPKSLLIRYYFLGKMHQCIIDDEQDIKIPLRKHTVTKGYMNNLVHDHHLSNSMKNQLSQYLSTEKRISTNDNLFQPVTMNIHDLQTLARQYYQSKEESLSSLDHSTSSPVLSRRIYSQTMVQNSTPPEKSNADEKKNNSVPYTAVKTTKKVRIIRSPLTAARNNGKLNQLRTVAKIVPVTSLSSLSSSTITTTNIDPVSKTIRFDSSNSKDSHDNNDKRIISVTTNPASVLSLSPLVWGSCIIGLGSFVYYSYYYMPPTNKTLGPLNILYNSKQLFEFIRIPKNIPHIVHKYTTILTEKTKLWYNGYVSSPTALMGSTQSSGTPPK